MSSPRLFFALAVLAAVLHIRHAGAADPDPSVFHFGPTAPLPFYLNRTRELVESDNLGQAAYEWEPVLADEDKGAHLHASRLLKYPMPKRAHMLGVVDFPILNPAF